MTKWLAKERGLLTVFFAGFLSILLIVVGILGDYLRVQAAGAEMVAGLRLSSHLALSCFDKKLAREYGLFAVRDLDEAASKTREAWEGRFTSSSIRKNSIPMAPGDLELEGVSGRTLSNPRVLEEEIDQFMDWQTPRLIWSELEAHFDIYHKISKLSPVMAAKSAYEQGMKSYHDQLVHMGDKLEKLPSLPETWTLVQGGVQIFKGIPSFKENIGNLKRAFSDLEGLLDRAVRSAQENSEEDEEGGAILEEDRRALKEAFDQVKKSYSEVKSSLLGLKQYTEGTGRALLRIKGSSADMEGKAQAWGSAIDGLAGGAMATSFQADFLAKTGQEDFQGFDSLAREMGDMSELVNKQLEAWKTIRFEDKPIGALSFSTWLEKEKELIERGNRGTVTSQGQEAIEGKIFSEEALDAQANLVSLSPDKRSGLLEFIGAWNQKRKMKNRAKWADKLNLSNLSGSLSSYISSESLARYTGASGLLGESRLNFGSLGGDQGIMDQVLSGFQTSASTFTLHNFADESRLRAKLYLYWSRMFSHRTSRKMDEKKGEDTLSLTGYPLKDRPFYGGELEYILFGRDAFLDNLRQAAMRIAGLRLIMNAAYAFSSSELYQETAPLAMAIAGWSGFGYPFIQSIFLSILAIGETKLDMDDLLLGKDVPLMKSPGNWRFALSGIKPLAQSALGDFFDAVDFQAQASVEAMDELVKEKMNTVSSSAKEMVKNAIKTPVQGWMTQALSRIQEPEPGKEEAELRELIGKMGSLAGSGSLDGAVRNAAASLSSRVGDLLSGLKNLRELKKKEKRKTGDLMKSLNDQVDRIVDPIVSHATAKVDGISSKWEGKLSGILQGSKAKSQEALGKWLDGFKKDMGGGELGTGLATGAGLTMNYEDYIKLFLFLSLTGSGKEALLVNTCKLVHAENGGLDLTTAPTALSWTGEVKVGLTFLGKNRLWSSAIDPGQSGHAIKRSWIEGYGDKALEPEGGGQ